MLSFMRRCSIAGRLSFGPPKAGQMAIVQVVQCLTHDCVTKSSLDSTQFGDAKDP
jgi:hypothetical protein